MDKRNNSFKFDFTPIGQAIKEARKARGMTREQLANIVDYDIRHLQAVENEGQYPSIELFIQLITMFDISVDEYIQYARFQGGYWILPTAASSARLSPAAIRNISIISNSKSEFFLQFFRDFIRTVFHGNLIVFLRAVLGIPHLCIERVLPCHLRVSP